MALSETILWLQYISCFSHRYFANEFSSPLGAANIARAIRGIVKCLERRIRRAISGPLVGLVASLPRREESIR